MKQARWTFADLKITQATTEDEHGRTNTLFHIRKEDMPKLCQEEAASPRSRNFTDFWLNYWRRHRDIGSKRWDTDTYTIKPEKSIPPEEHPGGFYVLFTFPLEDFLDSFTTAAIAAVEAANDRLSPADIFITEQDLSALRKSLVDIDLDAIKIVYLPVV